MGATGLFMSYFLGQAVSLVAHFSLYRKLVPEPAKLRGKRLLTLGWRHRDFARYSMPSQFLSAASLDMPVYALTAMGGIASLGSFNRARSLVSMPLGLIGGAVAQVFRQRAAEDYHRTGSCRQLYVRTGLGLFLVGLLPTLVLMQWAPDLFRMVLGPNWGEAGVIVQILAPMLLLRLASSPVSTVYFFTDHQRLDIIMVAIMAILSAVILGWSVYSEHSATAIIVEFALIYGVFYSVQSVIGWFISSVKVVNQD
jgi:O-antigen/teichoic acid export membrane protein